MTEELACPGDCNRVFRQHEQAGHDHDTPFVPGQPIWCADCRTRIEHDLTELHDLALGLGPGKLNTPRQTSTGDSKRTKAATYPSLSPGWDAADALIRWAVRLEDTTRARLGHSEQPQTMRNLRDSLRYLQAWSTAILSDTTGLDDEGLTPDGQHAGEQIRHHHRALIKLTGTDRLTHRLKGQCPRQRCGARGRLARPDGSEVVKCGACGAMWSWDYFQHLARAIVDTERISA